MPERPDGRLAVTGLPRDRGERQSLTWRLCDVLAAVCHIDNTAREGSGVLCRRYCRDSWPAWMPEVTVWLVRPPAEPPG